jgi:hypothetical protein
MTVAPAREALPATKLRAPTPRWTFDANYRPVDEVIREMWTGQGRATQDEALAIPGVLKARNIICGIASWPWVDIDQANKRHRRPLLEQLDPNLPNVVVKAQLLQDLLFEGVSWFRVLDTDRDGFPRYMEHLDWSRVTIDPVEYADGRSPLPSGLIVAERGTPAQLRVDGVPQDLRRIKRFDSPNPGVLQAVGATVKLAAMYRTTAAGYADNPRMMEFFRPTEGVDPVDDDEVEDLLDAWSEARKKRKAAYVPAALTHENVEVMTPAELQLVQLQEQATKDIAIAMGLEPEDLGVSTTSRTYANIVDKRQDRINDLLAAYLTAMNERLSMPDITPRGHRVWADPAAFLRSNPSERIVYYKGMSEIRDPETGRPALSVDEIREAETLTPLPDNPLPDNQAGQPSNVTPIRPGVDGEANGGPSRLAASSAAAVTFSADEHRFTSDGVAVGFEVDREKRTIRGLAVPYGVGDIGRKNGRRYRFRQGAIAWPADRGQVPFLVDHVMSHAVGTHFEIDDTADGTFIAVKVATGPEGDQVLAWADEKIRTGLSVGVDFDHDRDTIPDPDNPGAFLVVRAIGMENSLVAIPAFQRARVASVAMHYEGATVPEPTTPGTGPAPTQPTTPQTPPVPPPANAPPANATFSQDQLAAVFGAWAAGMPNLQPAAPVAVTPEGPVFVNPLAGQIAGQQGGAPAQVREAAPYRFDHEGNLTPGPEHDFSADLVAAVRQGEGSAPYKRALGFMREMTVGDHYGIRRHNFDIDRADLAGLNPVRQRPDLYVDQRDYRYPLTEATRRGTLSDITAFTLPKFNSASGLVAAHTEGVEPTPGTFTVTTQTITPTAKSGAIDMTREAWDQGGTPQASAIIWRQFNRSWNEALETGVATFLNTLVAATDITLTAGSVNKALAKAWATAVARLQFARGGADQFDMMAAEQELYVAMATAETDDGDPIFPMINPTNRNGTSTSRYRVLNAHGVEFAPAWALASTAGAPNNSWLFDSETVHTWDTGPQRLEFAGMNASGDYSPVAYVRLAVWGYQALANTDINGVRQVIYDTVA